MSANFGDLTRRGDATADWILCDLADPDAPREHALADLEREADRVARGLAATGRRPGEAVAIMAFNSAAFLAVFLGVLRFGAVAVPINNRASVETARHILADSGAVLLFCDASCPDEVQAAVPSIRVDDELFAAFGTPGGFESVQPRPGDLATILYTSGSTGLPKGVMHAHAGLMAMMVGSGALAEPRYRGRAIVAAPLYHMNGLLYSLLFLAGGGSMVLLPRFEAGRYVQAIHRYQVTAVTGVPPMIAMIGQTPGLLAGLDLSCVRAVTLGSAPLSDAVVGQTRAIFPAAHVSNVYGTTETGVPFGAHPRGLPTPAASVGYPAAHSQLRLADGDGPDDGVLEVRAIGAMTGYRNQPALTAARVRDGWYRTGDRFRRDADGFFYFVGREDDMFVCGGENIYPIEVERVLERMPGVAQACVVPVTDHRRGQMPVAFVVPAEAGVLTPETVRVFALEAGPEYMHPRRVFLVEALPLSAVNKIDRTQLAETAARLVAAGYTP